MRRLAVFLRASGPARRAGLPAFATALAFTGVLALGAVHTSRDGTPLENAVAYDIVIAAIALVLLVDLLRRRWTETIITDLVVELGKRVAETLRPAGRSAWRPIIVIGYWIPERAATSMSRSPVELPETGPG